MINLRKLTATAALASLAILQMSAATEAARPQAGVQSRQQPAAQSQITSRGAGRVQQRSPLPPAVQPGAAGADGNRVQPRALPAQQATARGTPPQDATVASQAAVAQGRQRHSPPPSQTLAHADTDTSGTQLSTGRGRRQRSATPRHRQPQQHRRLGQRAASAPATTGHRRQAQPPVEPVQQQAAPGQRRHSPSQSAAPARQQAAQPGRAGGSPIDRTARGQSAAPVQQQAVPAQAAPGQRRHSPSQSAAPVQQPVTPAQATQRRSASASPAGYAGAYGNSPQGQQQTAGRPRH
ncbi:MAG: hypothetical protein LBJ69_00515 [Holosporales bacterium]|nr:hypothetical protein [Holosporales bacterium]